MRGVELSAEARKAWPILLAVGGALLADLATKAWARAALAAGDVELLPALALRLRFNAGTTLGLLPGATGVWAAVFTAVAVLILGWAALNTSRQAAIAAALVAAGAAGNLIDRLLVGMVTDFVAVRWGTWQAPIFNLADVWIVTGAALLLLSRDSASVRRE